jgi:hypothetical protein
MDSAKNLVRLRGGPAVLLAGSAPAKPGVIEGISRNRLFLDILAVYEVAGNVAQPCESSSTEPL